MRIFVFACLIGLVVAGCIAEVTPQGEASSRDFLLASTPFQEWERYTVKGEEFSVSLPALPAMRTRKTFLMRLRKNRTERELGSYSNGVVYTIHCVENALRESLDDFIATQQLNALSNPISVSVNGFTGKQFEFTTPGLNGTVQFFATKNNFYKFKALGAASDDPRLTQFFTSIILGKRLGTEVEDGIGAEFVADNSGGGPEPTLVGKDVDRKAVIAMKPEPSYTDSARQGRITGTVVLRAIFAANGGVKDIRVVSGLPYGLTEQAIRALKQIRFLPAMKNGQFVSMWMQLEYNFNLY